MKQIENTLQDLKCMLIEDGYTEANIVLRTLIKAQEQVKNCSIPIVSQQRELLNALADNFNESTHTYVGQPMIEETLKAFNCA